MAKPYEQIGVAVTSRAGREYEAMFALEPGMLAAGPVLDAAAGASSFQADAMAAGIDVRSADPRYGMSPQAFAEFGEAELAAADDKLRRLEGQYDWSFYGSLDEHRKLREGALSRFLDHYSRHRERYVEASLPHLPFADGTFRLALCSHFLFLYGDTFGKAFHREALQELYRVLAPGGELRAYPLVTLRWEPYPHLGDIVQPLRQLGAQIGIGEGRLPFVPKPSPMLIVRKPETAL